MAFYLDSALLGLEYALLAMGVFLTFRILNIPDLTADGSFAFGVAVSGALTAAGHPAAGLALSLAAGAAAGCVAGLLQTRCGIHPILSGILTASGLYTVNLAVLGGPNLSLLNSGKFFTAAAGAVPAMADAVRAGYLLALCAAAIALMTLFFRTVLGLSIRASGDNEDMVRASSIDTTLARILALALANALTALSGAVVAQYQGFSDIGSGSGMIVVGLASVIIGEAIFGRRSVTAGLLSACAGSVVYRLLLALALRYTFLSANSLRLVSAVIVAAALSVPAVRRSAAARKKRRENPECCA